MGSIVNFYCQFCQFEVDLGFAVGQFVSLFIRNVYHRDLYLPIIRRSIGESAVYACIDQFTKFNWCSKYLVKEVILI